MRLRPVLLVLGLTCLVLAVGGVADASTTASPGTPAGDPLVEAGRQLYLTGCASCHGVDGAGVRIAEPADGIELLEATHTSTSSGYSGKPQPQPRPPPRAQPRPRPSP